MHTKAHSIGQGTRLRFQPHALAHTAWALATTAWLAGCATGPAFERPPPPRVAAYTATPVAGLASHGPAALSPPVLQPGAEVPSQWWQALGSQRLNAWIDLALQASPTLAAAQASLRQAQELQAAQEGSLRYPQIDASLGAQRQHQNAAAQGQADGAGRVFSLYNAGIGVRYRFDLAGGNQHALQALAARSEYRHYVLQGAQLTLVANMVSTAIARARLAGQASATQALLQAQEEQWELARQRVRLGHAPPDELWALQAQAEQTRAALALLHQQTMQKEHLMAVLAGQAPGHAQVPDFTLEEFTPPQALPLQVPSELVRRRPDILAAEALLHAATADYGVAVSRLYPQIQLSASLGSQALTTGALFGGGSAIWGLLGQLTQPLFNPALPAEKRAALAALDAASAHYQEAVLEALRNVADVLRALEQGARVQSALVQADAAAQGALQSLERQYALGAASYVQWVVARQQAERSRLELVSAQAQRLLDAAALFQAMGGGSTPEPGAHLAMQQR